MLLASTRWFAVWTGLVAAAAWTLVVFAWTRYGRWRALGAFLASYEVHKKLREDGPSARLAITRERGRLGVDFAESEDGEIGGTVTLSERFPKSGRGLTNTACLTGDWHGAPGS
jgi:hypothetical protein